MNNHVTVLDDLLPDPDKARRLAMTLSYEALRNHDGQTYHGIGNCKDSLNLDSLISTRLGKTIKSRMYFLRLGLLNTHQTGYIHADNGEASMAGVLYLNPKAQCRGGTAFWRHRETGLDATPAVVDKELLALLLRDSDHEERWEMTGLVDMRYNRYVTYSASVFHSRYPQQTWGVSKHNGRLIFANFYDYADTP